MSSVALISSLKILGVLSSTAFLGYGAYRVAQVQSAAVSAVAASTAKARTTADTSAASTSQPIAVNGAKPMTTLSRVARSSLPPEGARLSRAYGLWIPNPLYDTCPKWLHDSYWVYGPDGKVYPTWHPPVDTNPETGKSCTYGHEHGDDPAQSGMGDWPLPFGYVNEVLEQADPLNPRHEDHVGHKVMFKRDVRVGVPGDDISNFTAGSGPTCSILTKLHMGTHSPDAFTNNMHELFYGIRCNNGVEARWMSMHMFGPARSIDTACSGRVALGSASPSNSPTQENQSSRTIPDKGCVDDTLQAIADGREPSAEWYRVLREDWPTGFVHELRQRNDGVYLDNWGQDGADRNPRLLFEFNAGTYFIADLQSRYFDASQPNRLARTLDLCAVPQMRYFNPCSQVTQARAAGKTVTWDSPLSPFSGALRTNHFDWVRLQNTTSSSRFYSNAWGTVVRPARDAARGVVIEQFVKAPADGRMYYFGRKQRDYRAEGVRAPN